MRNDILEQAQEIRTSIDSVTGTMEDADAAKSPLLFLLCGWSSTQVLPERLTTRFLLPAEWNTSTVSTTLTQKMKRPISASVGRKQALSCCSTFRMSLSGSILKKLDKLIKE